MGLGRQYSPAFKASVAARLKRLQQGDPLYYASEKAETCQMLGIGIMVLAEWLEGDGCVTINTKRRALAARRRADEMLSDS